MRKFLTAQRSTMKYTVGDDHLRFCPVCRADLASEGVHVDCSHENGPFDFNTTLEEGILQDVGPVNDGYLDHVSCAICNEILTEMHGVKEEEHLYLDDQEAFGCLIDLLDLLGRFGIKIGMVASLIEEGHIVLPNGEHHPIRVGTTLTFPGSKVVYFPRPSDSARALDFLLNYTQEGSR